MSYANRVANMNSGTISGVPTIGWLGDSICEGAYMGANSDRYRFSSLVSAYFGAEEKNQAVSGRTLSSFLPYQTAAVGGAVANFNGEWLLDGSQWYWNRDGSWIAVTDEGTATNRVGTHSANLTNLYANSHVIIAQSGVNDNAANLSVTGGNDYSANGSYHYELLLKEIVARLRAANVTVMFLTGTTASDESYHGTALNYSQELIGRYSAASRKVAYELGIYCCDAGMRLNLELAMGRVDILTRVAYAKPDNQTPAEWTAYLTSKGDPLGTDIYRVFDESEDELHRDDADRSQFWYNLHPGPFGHYVIANEMIKFINEKGLSERF